MATPGHRPEWAGDKLGPSAAARRFDRWLPWLVGLALLAITTGACRLYRGHDQARILARAEQRMAEELAVAANTADRTFDATDAYMQQDAQHLQVLDARKQDIHDPEIAASMRESLIQQVAAVPSLISMSVLDSEGSWIVASRFRNPPKLPTVRDRPIWNTSRSQPSTRSFLLGPAFSPITGIPALVMGHTVHADDGRLLGVILAFPARNGLAQPFSVMASAGTQIIEADRAGDVFESLPGGVNVLPAWLLPAWPELLAHGSNVSMRSDAKGGRWLLAIHGGESHLINYVSIRPACLVLAARRAHEHVVQGAVYGMALLSFLLFLAWHRHRRQLATQRLAEWEMRDQLLHVLQHDPATQLLNRVGFERMLTDLGRSLRPVALHVIGMDGLESILQPLHADMENALLEQLTQRLGHCVGKGQLIGRLSGDEFGVAQFDGDAEAMASCLADQLSAPYAFGQSNLSLSVAVGFIAAQGGDWTSLIWDARTAMRRARSEGVGQYREFQADKDRPTQERWQIEQEFRAAIGTDQLYMMYQPIMDLASETIVGFEALMRWRNPVRGLVPPDVFIPIAEAAGLLLPLSKMVQSPPLDAAKAWPPGLYVSLNCTAGEFRDPHLVRRLRERLRKTGIPPECCCMEITESNLLADDEIVTSGMRELKELGVRLALDDFGTGHASLSYLQRYSFNVVKIDKSFISAMHNTPAAAAIVKATLALSHSLDMEVVAEGVETLEQLEQLREQGCTHVQGYLIGKPMHENEIPDFLIAFEPPRAAAGAIAGLQ